MSICLTANNDWAPFEECVARLGNPVDQTLVDSLFHVVNATPQLCSLRFSRNVVMVRAFSIGITQSMIVGGNSEVILTIVMCRWEWCDFSCDTSRTVSCVTAQNQLANYDSCSITFGEPILVGVCCVLCCCCWIATWVGGLHCRPLMMDFRVVLTFGCRHVLVVIVSTIGNGVGVFWFV